jgi:hypothetical protein
VDELCVGGRNPRRQRRHHGVGHRQEDQSALGHLLGSGIAAAEERGTERLRKGAAEAAPAEDDQRF